jgi:membrane protein required for colicin V production
MVETSLNLFDLIVVGVVGLSALLSFFRGLVREVLSLGAWVGASIITLYAFPHVAEWMQPHVNNTMISSGLAALGTFMLSLIIISLFNSLLLKYVKTGADVGLLDNGLGLAFGAARGVLLISVAYFILTVVMREEDYPDWITHSLTRPYVEKSAAWIARIAPAYLNEISPLQKKEGDSDKQKPNGLQRMIDRNRDEKVEIRRGDSSSDDTKWQSLDELRERMEKTD